MEGWCQTQRARPSSQSLGVQAQLHAEAAAVGLGQVSELLCVCVSSTAKCRFCANLYNRDFLSSEKRRIIKLSGSPHQVISGSWYGVSSLKSVKCKRGHLT